MRDDFWEQLNKYLSEPDIVGKMSSDLVKIKKENKKESVNPS
jgi:hypothetical protein